MNPNRSHDPNEKIAIDEADNEAPGITPTRPASMPRAEDDANTREQSPEFRDGKGAGASRTRAEAHDRGRTADRRRRDDMNAIPELSE